jgi:membrane protein required for colicin V production
MMVFLSIILNLILLLDNDEVVISQKVRQESFFYERVEAVIPAIIPYLKKELWEDYIPHPYRKDLEKKTDSTDFYLPTSVVIDSIYQQQHFNVD